MERKTNFDVPKSLKFQEAKDARLALIHEPHVKPLTDFVRTARQETGYGDGIPYFDPLDGGVNAKCLFIFEAPGPKAVKSGFVSRNNPDNSARYFWELNKEAGLERKLTVTWNIVPWYIGDGKKIRPATDEDIKEGKIYLARLLPLMPDIKVIVLGGKKAQKAEGFIKEVLPDIEVVPMMHTSPLVVNTNKENRGMILAKLYYVVGILNK